MSGSVQREKAPAHRAPHDVFSHHTAPHYSLGYSANGISTNCHRDRSLPAGRHAKFFYGSAEAREERAVSRDIKAALLLAAVAAVKRSIIFSVVSVARESNVPLLVAYCRYLRFTRFVSLAKRRGLPVEFLPDFFHLEGKSVRAFRSCPLSSAARNII